MIPLSLAALAAVLVLGPELVEVRRDDVRLLTDTPSSDHGEILAEVDFARREARALVARLGLTRKSREDLRLRVFAHESGFEDHRRRTRDANTDVGPWSYYNPRDLEVVATWAGGLEETRSRLRRQVARQELLQHAKSPPRWVEEGFAGVVEGLARDPFGDVLDSVNVERLEVVARAIERDEVCPLFELMDLQDVEYYGVGGAQTSPWPRTVLHAQSWGLLFFLLESGAGEDRPEEAARAAFLDAVVERLETGRWDQDSYRKKLEELAPAWRAAMLDPDLPHRSDTLRSAWAALYDGDAVSARSDAAAALRVTPSSRSARRVLARAAYALAEFAEARDRFEELAAGRDDDVDAALSAAISALRLAEETQSEPEARRAVLAAERAAERAEPGRKHEALAVAADAAEVAGDPKEALRFVRRALRLARVPADVQETLREREQELVRRAIGRSP